MKASQKGECGMTNFERITQSETTLADWLYYCINCDWCPICEECVIDDGPIRDRCFRLICEWLKRDEQEQRGDMG